MELIDDIAYTTRGRIVESDAKIGCNNDVYITLAERDLETVMHLLSASAYELASLFCVEGFDAHAAYTLLYAFEKKPYKEIAVFRLPLRWESAPSITSSFPSASWYEREATDGYGIRFTNPFDERRLFLHESYPEGFHPLQKGFKNSELDTMENGEPTGAGEYQFRKVAGEGVYEIPVGPVHAGIIEPGHFRFSVIGETIYHLEIRMFYKHRGIEKLAEGKTPEECVRIAESISGDEKVSNAVAYCNAIEKLCCIRPPERAWRLRTVFLEMERIYSLLGDLAGMCVDVAFPVGASPFFILREEILRQNKALTGSRFMKDVIGISGLKKDVPEDALKQLPTFLDKCIETFEESVEYVRSTPSVIDRFEKTGVIRKELLAALHITGPMARSNGLSTDTRIYHPYGLYEKIKPNVKTVDEGDVLARFETKASDILDSCRMIKKALDDLPSGPVSTDYAIRDGYATSLVECARGQSFHWIWVKNGVVDRYKIRTASFCNWQAIEHAVIGNIVPDFPLINKSFNLSYSGTDL